MSGRVHSLHIHPPVGGEPLIEVSEFNAVVDKGITEDKRYFGRVRDGKPAKRQVSLIEREVIEQHAGTLGVDDFAGGAVRSNIETRGVDLIALIGRDVRVGEAVLRFIEPRTPCHQMDKLAQGLRELMENGRQGVIATVVKSGRIRPGDAIEVIERAEQPEPAAASVVQRGMN